jgi:hypothetical protein
MSGIASATAVSIYMMFWIGEELAISRSSWLQNILILGIIFTGTMIDTSEDFGIRKPAITLQPTFSFSRSCYYEAIQPVYDELFIGKTY